jgi:hypothetical protein
MNCRLAASGASDYCPHAMRARARAHLCRTYCRRALLSAAFALSACNLDNAGDEPPRGAIYFPNALALSPHEPGGEARYLFVANSNFDLRYRTGSVQAYSLDALDAAIENCDERPCAIESTEDVLADEVLVSSFATALAPSPDGRFLFATTRTDASLTFVRLDADAEGDDVLDCGTGERRCELQAARAADADDPSAPMPWPNDAASITTGPLSDWTEDPEDDTLYVLVAHRGGEVSLFIEQPDAQHDQPARFELRSVLSRLPGPLTNIAFDPATRLAHLTTGATGIARVGVVPPASDGAGGMLYAAGMKVLAGTPDTRDLTFMPAVPGAGEALSEDSALIVAQEPNALLIADVEPTRNALGRARVKRIAVVGGGAARLASGMLGGRPIAIVACFDARALFVVDLQTMLTLSVVPNLSGPFEIEFDEARERLYVADFRSSVIRVIDLRELAGSQGERSAVLIATLGKPRVVQELR